MKTRNVIGQRIVRVEQQMISPGEHRSRSNSVIWLELEDGTRLMPVVREGDTDYHVDFIVNRTQYYRNRKTTHAHHQE